MRALLAIAVLAVVCSSAAGARTAPVVRISSATPLTVVGHSFAPRERLRLVVRFDGIRKVRTVKASVTGRFMAQFVEQAIEDRCSLGATVTRASGRAIAAKLPAPLCPPPARP